MLLYLPTNKRPNLTPWLDAERGVCMFETESSVKGSRPPSGTGGSEDNNSPEPVRRSEESNVHPPPSLYSLSLTHTLVGVFSVGWTDGPSLPWGGREASDTNGSCGRDKCTTTTPSCHIAIVTTGRDRCWRGVMRRVWWPRLMLSLHKRPLARAPPALCALPRSGNAAGDLPTQVEGIRAPVLSCETMYNISHLLLCCVGLPSLYCSLRP